MKNLKKIVPMLLSVNAMFPFAVQAADLTLEDAVGIAIENNIGLEATKEGENAAKASLDATKGQAGWSVSVRDGISFNKSEGNDFSSSNSLSLNGQYSLYDGGKSQNNIKSGELNIGVAELQTEKAKNDLVLNVTKAYYDVLEAKDSIKVKQETLDNYVAHLQNVNHLYTAGAKAKVDVLRTEVEVSDAQQALTKAEVSYDTKMARLKNYMNVDRDTILDLVSGVSIKDTDKTFDDYIKTASDNRPELKTDALKIKMAELSLENAKAGYKPTVGISAGVSRSDMLTNGGNSNGFDFSGGVSVNWNVFDSGVTKAQIAEKQSALTSAKLNLQNDMQTVDLDVRTAYLNTSEARSRFASTEAAVKKAEEDYNIAKVKYTAGEGLLLDIIDAQTALSNARLNYYGAQYDYARNKAELNHAAGITNDKVEK